MGRIERDDLGHFYRVFKADDGLRSLVHGTASKTTSPDLQWQARRDRCIAAATGGANVLENRVAQITGQLAAVVAEPYHMSPGYQLPARDV